MVKTPPPQSVDDLSPDLLAYMEIEREISKSHATWLYLCEKIAIPTIGIGAMLGISPASGFFFRAIGLFMFAWALSFIIERQNLRRLELVYKVLRGLRQKAQVKEEAAPDISDLGS